MTKILIFIIKIYQYFISPLLGNRCRFFPTCSEYCVEALKTHGLLIGLKLGIKRFLRCQPFKKLGGGNGVDFVPSSNNKESNNG
tara:strand:- start:278 stop:529 length:252 start_codon:yes stop_codon:yes gene_type:complete